MFGALAVSKISEAQVQTPPTSLTDDAIKRIKGNCTEAQASLTQLHASDALLRVTLGQLYESIATKLMTPLNSRIVLNKLDGSSLVSAAATYEQQLGDFRDDYQVYEQSLSDLLAIKCQDRPVGYFDGLTKARINREKVHDDVEALRKTSRAYGDNFEMFARKQKDAS